MKMMFLVIALIGTVLGLGSTAQGSCDGVIIADQCIVTLDGPFTIDQINLTYATTTIDMLSGDDDGDAYLLQLPPGLTVNEFIDLASMDSRIDDAEPNHELCVTEIDPGTQSFFLTSIVQNYGNQIARARTALDRDIGAAPEAVARGSGVLVAIIDSGVDTDHPALAGRISASGVSLIPGDPSIEDAGDGMDNDGDGLTDEIVGHGTFVAGLALFAAPGATIVPIRVLDSDGRSDTFRVARAVEEAMVRGADVINLSLGTTTDSEVLIEIITRAVGSGIVVVASVGNDAAEVLRAPASISGVLAVAGVDRHDNLAAFSSYGGHVSFTAPAVGIVGPVSGSGYGIADGTSYAAPMVAGLAALILGADPMATPGEVRDRLAMGAIDIDDLNPEQAGKIGLGRISARQSLSALGLAAPYAASDLDANGAVGLSDLNRMLGYFGSALDSGDINDDQQINLADLLVLLFEWEL